MSSKTNNIAMTSSNLNASNLTAAQYKDLVKSFTKSIIKKVDMSAELQSEAIDIMIAQVDEKKGNYEAAAKSIKEIMDRKFGPSWNCIIGEGFGYECTYEKNNMILVYYLGKIAILLFKT